MTLLDTVLTSTLIVSTAFTLLLIALPSRNDGKSRSGRKTDDQNVRGQSDGAPERSTIPNVSVQVLVLGDLGRSPRMQYHAMSLAKHGADVALLGYSESELHPGLTGDAKVSVVAIAPPPAHLETKNKVLFLLLAPLKVMWQLSSLWLILAYRTKPADWLLVQNPPSIPTLAIAQAVCFLRRTRLIIDWHNLGWSILALKLGQGHPLVKLAKGYEQFFGRFATINFTVTDALARWLRETYHVKSPILSLHDRPQPHFRPRSPAERATFLTSLPLTAPHSEAILSGTTRLLVSSTSWTPDEDFSILLDALVAYSETARTSPHPLPNILAIITGKGAQRAHYLALISALSAQRKLTGVTVLTAWMTVADYASLLGSADLGVSLHKSSSGLDLPMKVVDMFGAGLPVVGWSEFEAWGELVTEGVNGRGFRSAVELSGLLVRLIGGDGAELGRLKNGAVAEARKGWDEQWAAVAGRLFGLCE